VFDVVKSFSVCRMVVRLMHVKKIPIRELVMTSSLATVSVLLQLIHIGYQSPQFGMWIDFVACSWIIAFFLFGIRGALLTSSIGAIIITFFSPETWLGASMKWTLSLPNILCLYSWAKITHHKTSIYANTKLLCFPVLCALILRGCFAIPLNYYYAIPIWLGIPSQQAIAVIPWYIIAVFNALQSLVDVILAWVITFHFKIINFGNT